MDPDITLQSKGLTGVPQSRKSNLKGGVYVMAILWGEGTHDSVHLYLCLFKATTYNNQPTVLRTVRLYCSKGFERDNKRIRASNTKIGLVNVRGTNPNLLRGYTLCKLLLSLPANLN